MLLQLGLPAWWEAVRSAPGPSTRVVPPSVRAMAATSTGDALDTSRTPFDGVRNSLIAASQFGDIVTLLAGLVLSAHQPRHERVCFDGAST